MIFFVIYLLKVSASMLGLFTVYYLLLRHHTFHRANRICLLLIICFSFLVPVAPIPVPSPSMAPIGFDTDDYYYSDRPASAEQFQMEASTDTSQPAMLATVFYLLGVILFSFRFLKSVVTLCEIGRKTTGEIRNGFRVKRTDLKTSFTFLNTIFVPKAETNAIILEHEQAHVTQFHWIDLLLAEVAFIILWFNPVMILLKRELRLQHEFLADRSVIAKGISFEDYAQCLVRSMRSAAGDFNTISPLHSSSNKKRIIMMTKRKTSSIMFAGYLLMVPALAIMLMAFGKEQSTDRPGIIQTQQTISPQNIPDIAPVDFAKVTRVVLYGEIMDPRTNRMRKHTGIDFELSAGSDVVATADGVVAIQRYGDNYGNYVLIKHSETYSTRYSHLAAALVKRGEKIAKGQRIGLVGSTGVSSTTPHLHYEIEREGKKVDPKDYLPDLPAK